MYSAMDSSKLTRLQVLPKKIDFGDVESGDSLSGRFWIKNIGGIDFHVDTVASFCDCLSVRYAQLIIPPNDSIPIDFVMRRELDSEGKQERTILTIGNGKNGCAVFLLSANVKPNR